MVGPDNRRGPAVIDTAPALPQLSADEVRRLLLPGGVVVVDVRPVPHVAAGHILGAIAIHSAAHAAPVAAVVMCGHGERAMTAATLLHRTGRRDVAVLIGGPDDWATATDRPLQEPS